MPPGRAEGAPPALEAVGIDKRFGARRANIDVSMAVARGTIHGLVGENGAGKSTLMNIVYGYYRADGGEVRVGGRHVRISGPDDAIALGIGMVHQHFMLVDDFTVLENVVLGAERGFLLRRPLARARRAIERLGREYGLEADPDAVAGALPVGVRQRVEILKALYRGADILILDEPTSVLTPGEADNLFRVLRALRDGGGTVVLITHKLREIAALCDRVTVMRGGRAVAHADTADTDRESLAAAMVGRPVSLAVRKDAAAPGAAVLEARGLAVRDRSGALRVRGASFAVRAGEIVGVAGVAGNGQSELLEAIAGTLPAERGEIRIAGAPAPPGGSAAAVRARRRLGLAHLPEDRQRTGLVAQFDAAENGILGYHRRRGPWLGRRAMIARARRDMARFDVRPADPFLPAAAFSGGNRQKIVAGRELGRDPDLVLAGQPTLGIDIGAAASVRRRLLDMRRAGKAILLVSSELDEILALSDRILAMYDGRIVGEMAGAEADAHALGALMAGGAAPGRAGSAGP